MSDLDFYNYFYQQTEKAYGSLNDDYPKVPQVDKVQVLDEASLLPVATAAAQTYSAPTPPQQPTAAEAPRLETYSFGRPVGAVPEGYVPSRSCATCQYFEGCGGYCYKHDYPASGQYVCSSYSVLASQDCNTCFFSENCLMLDVATLQDTELEILAEGWTKTTGRKVVLSEGRFPVTDKRSALSALKLRDKATTSSERVRLIEAASRFAPEEARAAREQDSRSVTLFSDKVPTQKALFSLVASSVEAEGDEKCVYGMYEELYAQRYGDVQGAYLETNSVETLEPLSETVPPAVEPAQLPQEAESESVKPVVNRTLYQVAENRVAALAKQQGAEVRQQDIDKEYERLVLLRKGEPA